jgi:hypothetical protein
LQNNSYFEISKDLGLIELEKSFDFGEKSLKKQLNSEYIKIICNFFREIYKEGLRPTKIKIYLLLFMPINCCQNSKFSLLSFINIKIIGNRGIKLHSIKKT